MVFIRKSAKKKAGLSPGSLLFLGEKKVESVKVSVMEYAEHFFREGDFLSDDEVSVSQQEGAITWINVDGLHDVELIKKIGTLFDLHPLVLEDILSGDQRPKLEEYDDVLFCVVRMLQMGKDSSVTSEQISVVLTKDAVISFQETEGDVFTHLRERIRTNKGRVRKMGADYLFYSLLDSIVDEYFIILERLSDMMEDLQEELFSGKDALLTQKVHQFRRDTIFLRRAVWPLHDVLTNLLREGSPLIHPDIHNYLRDLGDHANRAADVIDTFRDFLAGILDTHMLMVSHKMNEVIKVLTVVTTLFMPLTFVVGIYGMNFRFMPELGWKFGYPYSLLILASIAIGMLFYFHRKRWV